MTDVLKHAEAITHSRDHALVDIALVRSLLDLLNPKRKGLSIRLFRVHEIRGRMHIELTAWSNGMHVEHGDSMLPVKAPPPLLDALDRRAFSCATESAADGEARQINWFPILQQNSALACVEIGAQRPIPGRLIALIGGMLNLYRNYLSLLEYSQIDTLTGLLNRKTFEDSLGKLLAAPRGVPAAVTAPAPERREDPSREDWLAMIDIDHFKRINDRFGHVFGDEVLIAMADQMRQIFRRNDKLFRFGGEEFVVILRHTPEPNALKVMERFRRLVQESEFPQVGSLSVSIGLTRMRPQDTPTMLLGRADEALYHAKRHGRNRLSYYEALLKTGAVAPQSEGGEFGLF